MADKKKSLPKGETRKTIGKIFRYIKRYIPILIISILLAGVIVVLTLMIPVLTGS